jgi:PAS domain S-box-containing protein
MKLPASLKNASILRKLVYIAVIATAAATLFTVLILVVGQWFSQRNELEKSLYTQASIVAENSSSALVFGDHEAAEQTLAALATIDNIEFAALLDNSGQTFAVYVRPGFVMPPHQHLPLEVANNLYTTRYIEVLIPIVFKQERIGSIQVRSNLSPLYKKLTWSVLIVLIAAMGACLVAVAMLLKLLPAITDPLQYLVGLMNTVSREKNYTLRAEMQSQDELGTLAQEFNKMLVQIEQRDDQLARHREHLEEEVARRSASLRESEERFRMAFQNSAIGMALVGLDGSWLKVNDSLCKIVGYSEQELLGKTFQDITHPDDLQTDLDFVAQLLAGEIDYFQVEKRYVHKDGRAVWIRLSVSLIRDAEGKPVHFVSQMDDITEDKLAEKKIQKLNEELESKVRERTQQLLQAQEELVRKEKLAVLGQVAGSVGHELRNPLGVMSNAVYFLQTVLTDADDSVKEYLDIIKSEIAGSERIVSDLLDSVRTKPPQPDIVDVQELIEQTLHRCAVPPSVTVKRDIPATLLPLRVDAMQIQQVLRNLIRNGIEAMPEGGTLEIRALENRQDETVTVSVRDSGIGMTPEVLTKLFQPLFTTKARGIGLGLVVVKNLTQANGGSVKVESEVGKGTLFTVTLPADQSKRT